MMVTHRAVEITEDGIVTKGDANHTEDSSVVTSENFIGQTVFHIPKVGVFAVQVKTVRGKVLLGFVVVLFIAVNMVLNWLKKEIENTGETIEDKAPTTGQEEHKA